MLRAAQFLRLDITLYMLAAAVTIINLRPPVISLYTAGLALRSGFNCFVNRE